MTLSLVGTVTHGASTAEVVTLHDTGETATLAGSRHIDELTGGEEVGGLEFVNLVLVNGIRRDTELLDLLRGLCAILCVESGGALLTFLALRLPKPNWRAV